MQEMEKMLWGYVERSRKFSDKDKFIKAIKASCVAELEPTLNRNIPPSSQKTDVVRIERQHCSTQELYEALSAQKAYGVVLKDYAPERQPTLQNGQIMCWFAGAPLRSVDDKEAYKKTLAHPLDPERGEKAIKDYAVLVKKYGTKVYVEWAPYGGGNTAQYFNSAFDPIPMKNGKRKGKPDECHAFMLPATILLKDRDGNLRKETMMIVVQHADVEDGRQVLLEYGGKYTLDAPAAPGAPGDAGISVKEEPDDD